MNFYIAWVFRKSAELQINKNKISLKELVNSNPQLIN